MPNGELRSVPRRLFDSCWGNYVAVARDDHTGNALIARDPGGGLTLHVIDAGGVAVLTDALPSWLAETVDRPTPVDRVELGRALALPILSTYRSLLRNVRLVVAGQSLEWDGRFGATELVWDPVAHCRTAAAPQALRAAVLDATEAHSSKHDRLMLELSGGLDSAVVLGALAARTDLSGVRCINFTTGYAGGDERATARDAASRASIELVEVAAHEAEIDYRAHLSGPQPLQPLLYGLDPVLEASSAGVAGAFGASAIFTGQGGDSVFYQMPTDKVALDAMRAYGIKALFSRTAFDAARRTHASIWRMQWRMLLDRFGLTRLEQMPPNLAILPRGVAEDVSGTDLSHPWLAGARGIAPGKHFHLLVLANCQLFNGPTPRGRSCDLIHPLMSQPVVEACLGLPSYMLSHGSNDRALARELFADLLPPSIARRRGKGEASGYYRRALVHNLVFLKEHLLDGTLAANGLLDPDAIAPMLDEDALLWREDVRVLTVLASFEAWARYWRL